MADVPDTNTFSLQDVVASVVPTTDDLVTCFAEATGVFDPTYEGAKDRLSNFRNYKDVIPFIWGNWTTEVEMIPPPNDFSSLAMGNGMVAVCNEGGDMTSDVVGWSLDGGITWNIGDLSNLIGGGSLNEARTVRFVNGFFVFLTASNSAQNPRQYVFTADFVTWNTGANNGYWTDICWNGTYYFATDSDQTSEPSVRRMTTLDGVMTNVGALGGITSLGNTLSVQYQNGTLVVLSNEGGNVRWFYNVSLDGTGTWLEGTYEPTLGNSASITDYFRMNQSPTQIRVGDDFQKWGFFFTDDQGATGAEDVGAEVGGVRPRQPVFGFGEWAASDERTSQANRLIVTSPDEGATWISRIVPLVANASPIEDCAYDESTNEFGFINGRYFIKTTGN